MSSIVKKTPIRIPVKLVEGQWEFFYGGGLPVCDGAVGELIVDKRSIEDKEFLYLLNRKSEYKILESGTQLRVALTVKLFTEIPSSLKKQLITMNATELGEYTLQYASPDTQFAQITIGKPTTRQMKICPNATGGVWLQLQGTQPKSIITSSVIVPGEISQEPLDSLNHAFTRLSEVCEPWRKSHTGNIYDRVLYQEKNGRWYSLSTLRDAAIATDEHQLVKEQWALIMQKMTSFHPNLGSK